MKFAIKCSYVEVTGIGGFSVAKDPITDKSKRNKPGRLKLIKHTTSTFTTMSSTEEPEGYEQADDQLVTVFENGKLLKEYSLDTIRATCDIDINKLDSMLMMQTSSS